MTIYRPRLAFRPGDTVWTPQFRERHVVAECPACHGRGWHESGGRRRQCLAYGCDCGLVRKPLRSYEVPVSGLVVSVTIGDEADVLYDVDLEHGRPIQAGAEMFFNSEAECAADIVARGFAPDQREEKG